MSFGKRPAADQESAQFNKKTDALTAPQINNLASSVRAAQQAKLYSLIPAQSTVDQVIEEMPKRNGFVRTNGYSHANAMNNNNAMNNYNIMNTNNVMNNNNTTNNIIANNTNKTVQTNQSNQSNDKLCILKSNINRKPVRTEFNKKITKSLQSNRSTVTLNKKNNIPLNSHHEKQKRNNVIKLNTNAHNYNDNQQDVNLDAQYDDTINNCNGTLNNLDNKLSDSKLLYVPNTSAKLQQQRERLLNVSNSLQQKNCHSLGASIEPANVNDTINKYDHAITVVTNQSVPITPKSVPITPKSVPITPKSVPITQNKSVNISDGFVMHQNKLLDQQDETLINWMDDDSILYKNNITATKDLAIHHFKQPVEQFVPTIKQSDHIAIKKPLQTIQLNDIYKEANNESVINNKTSTTNNLEENQLNNVATSPELLQSITFLEQKCAYLSNVIKETQAQFELTQQTLDNLRKLSN